MVLELVTMLTHVCFYCAPPCPSLVFITAPPHNPNPSNSSWSSNFSFVSSTSIQALAYASNSLAEEFIEWVIIPTIGTIQNVAPADQKGPMISFQPSVSHSPGGSTAARPALSYSIYAGICQSQHNVVIKQDSRDIVRQEYVHHQITVPARSAFAVAAQTTHFQLSEISQSPYSQSPHNLILGNPGGLGESVRSAYNGILKAKLGNPSFPDQGLVMNSGWRSPEYNETIQGSQWTSSHQYGNAVDLEPLFLTQAAAGRTRTELLFMLEEAGDQAGNGFCERGGTQVNCDDPLGVSHVHVQPL